MFPNSDPSTLPSWHQLKAHFDKRKAISLKEYFTKEPNRPKKFYRQFNDLYVDFSKNHLSDQTLELLLNLAKESGLSEAILAMKNGEAINQREKREVLHTALRSNENEIKLNGENLVPLVQAELAHVKQIADDIDSGKWLGHTGKQIRHIVNIGIGGSDLGPQMVCNSLKPYWRKVTPHFLSNIDGSHWEEIKEQINPEETLFIIASKTFTTDETMTNARTVRSWFLQKIGTTDAIQNHFVAVSTNISAVEEFGIPKENILGFWDWVGGRFSLWSSVGLSIACTIGYDNFKELLKGAEEMDTHFFHEEFGQNLPVVLALISIWQVNFWRFKSKAILPYDHNLRDLPRFLQQLIMESNGKQVDRNGHRVNYSTCPVYFGEPGTNGQHAFYQLLHQGTEIIPTDFIVAANPSHPHAEHHDKLIANCFAQSEALMDGQTSEDAYRNFEGNRPSNTIILKELSPRNLGSLIALYEHQVFVQGVIWNIFSFDQWGVELGKQLAKKLSSRDEKSENVSTQELLAKTKLFRVC